jgi:hypothetical protein
MSKRNGSYKGCCRMCAVALRGEGDSKRMHHQELAVVGRARRTKRKGVPQDELTITPVVTSRF